MVEDLTERKHSYLWDRARNAIQAFDRLQPSDQPLPSFYFDGWLNLTSADKDKALEVIQISYPSEVL